MEQIIHIDKYEPRIESNEIHIYAVKGKNHFPIPSAYADMCDNNHLAITLRTLNQPELYDTTPQHYIPLYTGDNHNE